METFSRIEKYLANLLWKIKTTEHIFMVIIAIIIGLIGGFGSVGIQELIKFFKNLMWGAPDLSPDYFHSIPWYMKIIVPVGGAFIVGLIIQYFSKEAKGHGVPEVMEAIALKNGVIRPRVVLAKLFASALYIASGGSVGREGPVIQIGSAIGSTVGQLTKVNPQRMKIFVACGAAAGIAGAFNAPVAGALFAIEIILGDFGVAQFSPIVISSVMATVVSRHFLGDFPAFIVPKYELVHPFELAPYALVGLFAGVVALLFIRTLYWFEDFYDKFKLPEYIKSVSGGLMIGTIGIFIPHIFGVGYHSIDLALYGKIAWQMMGALILLKILATSISLGSGGSGGVFAPSLFLGAMTGGFLGSFIHAWFPGISASAGAYALVGMGAVVAGATHAPITAILIIFELTNDYKIILPLMIACILATIITTFLQKESIYTLKLVRRGINIFEGKEVNILRSIKVSEAVNSQVTTVNINWPLRKVLEAVSESNHRECFVVDNNHCVVGVVPMANIRRTLADEAYIADLVIALDLMENNIPIITVDDKLDHIMRLFSQYELAELPVVENAESKKLVGIITRRDIMQVYNRELQKRNMAQELTSSIRLLEKSEFIDFLPDTKLAKIPINPRLVGKTILEMDFRKKFDVQILLILKPDSGNTIQIFPHPDYTLEKGDQLVVMGKEKNIRILKNY